MKSTTVEFTEQEVLIIKNAMDLFLRQNGTAIMKYTIDKKEYTEPAIYTISGILKKLDQELKQA